MKSIIQAMLEEIMAQAYILSLRNNQHVGEKNYFYITIEQLERILKSFED